MEAVIKEETQVTHKVKQHLNNDTLKENMHALANIWLCAIILMFKTMSAKNWEIEIHSLNCGEFLCQYMLTLQHLRVFVIIIIVKIRLDKNLIWLWQP